MSSTSAVSFRGPRSRPGVSSRSRRGCTISETFSRREKDNLEDRPSPSGRPDEGKVLFFSRTPQQESPHRFHILLRRRCHSLVRLPLQHLNRRIRQRRCERVGNPQIPRTLRSNLQQHRTLQFAKPLRLEVVAADRPQISQRRLRILKNRSPEIGATHLFKFL